MINGIYRTFSKILKTAMIDGLISRSPCIGIDLPKQTSHEEMKFLTLDQVEALAEAIGPRFRALIYTAAYTGMRWGRACWIKDRKAEPPPGNRRRRGVDVRDQRVSRGPADEDWPAEDPVAAPLALRAPRGPPRPVPERGGLRLQLGRNRPTFWPSR
jgi:hypothetical protein